jgi:phosphoribosylformylglycinamidine synthase subunit PurL
MIKEPKVDVSVARELGLLEEEFEKIKQILGREPNFTELSVYSVMWSEHCSYKNSISWLKTLPRKGGSLLVEAGEENAGLVDIGHGLACAFKIESHNHPSAIEPYQGAATGVGGIHRDIFTMGARPIAALNSLRFGDPDLAHTKHLIKGVVSGIGNYGNSFGVPTIGGEVYFDDCYNQNILVNAMSVGIVKVGETVSAVAEGIGNPVFIVGSATGKDGIHGATFASADLTEDSSEDLPSVQVGDPFQEKLLLEATLEAIQSGLIVGMQDMGAAGICCSTSEMSAKSQTGMDINLDLVPTRQANMRPFEILLSESQERMLIVSHKGKEIDLKNIFEKWDVECTEIGEVTHTQHIRFYAKGELVVDVQAESLVLGGGAPVYHRNYTKPAYFKQIEAFNPKSVSIPENFLESAKKLAKSPNLVSKKWIANQYDSMVRINNLTTNRPSDASVIRVINTDIGLALTVDCNSSYVFADPYKGAMIAVSEAARNIVCSGGKPLAVTNCLNFGNPYNPEVYYQFVKAIEGMGEACLKFNTPVTGGNVSFYNQTVLKESTDPVHPTPTIGMLGILEDLTLHTGIDFRSPGDVIYLIGSPTNDLGSSEYLRKIHGIQFSPAPQFDLDEEYQLQVVIAQIIKQRLIYSAHDVSEGGLFFTLLESCYNNGLGFDIETDAHFRKDAYLFGESQSRVIVSVSEHLEDALVNYINSQNVSFVRLGQVTNGDIMIDSDHFGDIKDWKDNYINHLNTKLS